MKILIKIISVFYFTVSISAAETVTDAFVKAATGRTKHTVRYDGRYYAMSYPGGDVSHNVGVCTDVIIRSYRKIGIDLQKLVHLDMKANFEVYPSRKIWGLIKPDTNIDHRRVPNLQVFFMRNGQSLPVSNKAGDYSPGDLVTWALPGNLLHIGIVTGRYDAQSGNPMIIHNIGRGPRFEDMLFSYEIKGHYRYLPN